MLDCNATGAVATAEQFRSGNRGAPPAQAAGESGLVAENAIEYGDFDQRYQQSTFGPHSVEIGVDATTGDNRPDACSLSTRPSKISLTPLNRRGGPQMHAKAKLADGSTPH